MENLFAYGTLMCEDIMQDVAGCRLSCVPAELRGYSRRRVRGEHYPALVPDERGFVRGVLYQDVPDSAWDRLDRFEGDMYERRPVEVCLEDGRIMSAATYVARSAFLGCLDEADWDFDDFLRSGRAAFQRQYKGYQAL